MSILEKNCRIALSALQVQSTRNSVILMDETVWCPMWELMTSLRDEPGYIGGGYETKKEEDFSFIPQGAVQLPMERLSKLVQHFGICRADNNQRMFFLDILPRTPKAGKKGKVSASVLIGVFSFIFSF